jgi:hypothetical protein
VVEHHRIGCRVSKHIHDCAADSFNEPLRGRIYNIALSPADDDHVMAVRV